MLKIYPICFKIIQIRIKFNKQIIITYLTKILRVKTKIFKVMKIYNLEYKITNYWQINLKIKKFNKINNKISKKIKYYKTSQINY